MNELYSHPHLRLHKHIEQITEAIRCILHRHSQEVLASRTETCELADRLARLHDLGKGSKAFQIYITDPDKYRGDRLEKAHTPLSLILVAALAQKERWGLSTAIALIQAVNGHHDQLFTRDELDNRLHSDDIATVLRSQLDSLDLKLLEKETGVPVSKLDLSGSPWLKVADFLEDCWEEIDGLPLTDAVRFRLWTQMLFSILLEADKAFLAVSEPAIYLKYEPISIPVTVIDNYIWSQPDTPLNTLRQEARKAVLRTLSNNPDARITTVTLPTGLGKTLVAANWAFALRERLSKADSPPKIIVVLPFLSILDQTEETYRKLLNVDYNQSSLLMPCHSLADRTYDPELDGDTADFFIDTWRSEVVITTYDQFLMALLDPKTKYQMRFHNLCDSLIVMDEVQTLPCRLWNPLDQILNALVVEGNSRILAMSATMPVFLSESLELVSDLDKYFSAFGRYSLSMNHQQEQNLKSFLENLRQRVPFWVKEGRRVLVVLNTRRSAKMVRDAMEEAGADPLYFLSADVTPGDRLKIIQKIKEGRPCIVVSTQCIEAGVDIDMDFVIRDFAPLDSIIQVAGRCNRNGKRPRCTVEIVSLKDDHGKLFCNLVPYDPIHLQETRKVLSNRMKIDEEEVLGLCQSYFAGLAVKKDIGKELTEAYARWKETQDVRELLRGEYNEQYQFLVLEQDPTLKHDLDEALKIKDRWQRRRALRALSGRIARITVSIYARRGFYPRDIADEYRNLWLLKPGYYSTSRGLDLPQDNDKGKGVVCIL